MELSDQFAINGSITLLVLLLVFVLGLMCAYYINAWLLRRMGKVNQRRGRRAEHRARDILESEGFEILDIEPRIESRLLVNGDDTTFVVTPDLLVSKDGVQYVVEVKQLDDRSGVSSASVRRQVIEYVYATGMPCLLIRMPEGDIDMVELFPEV